MKHAEQWHPTKFVKTRRGLRGSRNRSHVQVSSRLLVDRLGVEFQRLIDQHVRGDLLDHGCGPVPLFDAYRSRVASVTCVDWPGSPHDVQHADVLCDVNGDVPIADGSFDTIICSDVLEHLHRPAFAVSEMNRMLRPGGKVLLSVPFMYGLHEQPFDFHRYTRHTIVKWAEQNSMDVIELKEVGGAGDVLCNVLAKVLIRIPLVGEFASKSVQFKWSLLRSLSWVKRLDEKSSVQFPIEYVAVLAKPSSAVSVSNA
jgi:SAM-dependent methyltransferase